MKSEGVPPTRHWRESMLAGRLAELVAVPMLLVVALLVHERLRWGYLAGAIAAVFISLLYFALFLALTRGTAEARAQELSSLVLSSLAIATLALLELGTSAPFGTFLPGCLVIVVFMSLVGDRSMLATLDCVAIGAVLVVGWVEGLRGDHLMAVVLVYATAAVLITWLVPRSVTSRDPSPGPSPEAAPDVAPEGRRSGVPASVQNLRDILAAGGSLEPQPNRDLIREILRRGLPLVPAVIEAERVTVFVRNGESGRFMALATCPEDTRAAGADPGSCQEVAQALQTDRVALGDHLLALPIGYCSEGELVMTIQRAPAEATATLTASDAEELAATADAVASAFLRATSRANFVTGVHIESRTDPLTGLPSRRTLYERIEIEMEHALRSDSPLSVAMIDLDHFKHYNDQHGPVAGDTLLRSIAALFVSNIRGQDLVVRYGGEEFCLVMPDTDILGAHHLLDKLRDGGRDATTEFGITLSAGLTSWDGIEDTSSMIERADQALDRAKQTGRNRVVSIQSVTEY